MGSGGPSLCSVYWRMLMRLITITCLTTFLFLCGCAPKNGNNAAQLDTGNVTDAKLLCSGFGGLQDRVCPTSFYNLIANSKEFNQRVIAVRGYLRTIDGDRYFFPTEAAAGNRDIASGVLCDFTSDVRDVRGKRELPEGVFITLIGRFSSEVIVTSDLFPPIGRMKVMVIR